MPMKNFTQEEMQPSEKVLEFIRLVAYTYRPRIQADGGVVPYCVN